MIPYVDSTSSYIYSLATDFGGVISPACLDREIRDTFEITDPFIGVFMEAGDDRVVLAFYAILSSGEQTTLDTVVANHDPGCNLGGTGGVDTDSDIIPNDGDVLVYDSTSGLWISQAPTGDTPQEFWKSLEIDRVENDGLSSTTAQTWQNKTAISYTNDSTTASIIIRIGYTIEFNAANNNKATEVEFYETVLGVQHGNSLQQTNAASNWFVFSGFHYEEIPPLATRTYQINFRVYPGLTTTCSVRHAELEIWRAT